MSHLQHLASRCAATCDTHICFRLEFAFQRGHRLRRLSDELLSMASDTDLTGEALKLFNVWSKHITEARG